jgi:transposase-like protein
LSQADIDNGRKAGLSTDEQAELMRLRKELRVAQMGKEILLKAAAFFAQENVKPK